MARVGRGEAESLKVVLTCLSTVPSPMPRSCAIAGVGAPLGHQGQDAADLRFLGRAEDAQDLDTDVVGRLAHAFGDTSIQAFRAETSVARDLLDLGRYADALLPQRKTLSTHEGRLADGHRDVLYARRNEAVLLRKTGEFLASLQQAQASHEAHRTFLGDTHEQTLAATLTLANALRAAGELLRAREVGQQALDAYWATFGERHPTTFAATVNLALGA